MKKIRKVQATRIPLMGVLPNNGTHSSTVYSHNVGQQEQLIYVPLCLPPFSTNHQLGAIMRLSFLLFPNGQKRSRGSSRLFVEADDFSGR